MALYHLGYQLRVASIGTFFYHSIIRVGEYVCHGREIQIESQIAHIRADGVPDFIRLPYVLCGADF